MSKLMRVLTLAAGALRGAGRRVAGAWLFADLGGLGGAYTGNAIRQWTGSSYTPHDNDDPPGTALNFESIQDVANFADDNIWVLFPDYAAHWDGTAWSFVEIDPSYEAPFVALAVLAPDDMYAVQAGLDIYHVRYWHWDGLLWSGPTTVDFTPTTIGVTGLQDADIAPSGVLRATGDRIVSLTGTPAVEYFPFGTQAARLWCRTSGDDWAVLQVPDGGGNVVLRGSGGTWAPMSSQPSYSFDEDRFYRGIHGIYNEDTAEVEAWIVGEVGSSDGTTFAFLAEHWSGTAWTRWPIELPSPYVRQLLDVRMEAPDDVWATGYARDAAGDYTIRTFHFDGSAWTDRSPTA